jgi:hypothetical protein
MPSSCAFFVDMGNHHLGMFDGIGFRSHMPPYIFSNLFKQVASWKTGAPDVGR